MWIFLTLASALVLGVYDIFKKHAVHGNAVLPTLLFSTLSGGIGFSLYLTMIGGWEAAIVDRTVFSLVVLKALLVAGSWYCAYTALRDLPVTIGAPIRASSPVWTLLGALILFREAPTWAQWLGLAVVAAGHWLLSRAGRHEGIDFRRHRGVWLMMLATFLGAASSLYDKYLLQTRAIPCNTVQFWFAADLVVCFLIALAISRAWPRRKPPHPFHWRWSIPLAGLALVVADQAYFQAVHTEGVLISVVSMLRRSSILVTFVMGALVFKDTNLRRKGWAVLVLLAGILLLCLTPEVLRQVASWWR